MLYQPSYCGRGSFMVFLLSTDGKTRLLEQLTVE